MSTPDGPAASLAPRALSSLGRLVPFLRPYATPILIAPALLAAEVFAGLLQPRLLQTVVDKGILASDFGVVLHMGLLMIGLAIVGVACGVANTLLVVPVAQGFGADVRAAVFRKVHSLSVRNLDELGTGNLITRCTNDVTQLQDALQSLLRIFVRAPLILLGSIVLAVLTSPSLAFIMAGIVPVLFVAIWVFFRFSHAMFTRMQARLDALNRVTQENIAGVRVVKAFARADHEAARFERANEDLTAATAGAMRFGALIMPFMELVVDMALGAAVWYGTRGVSYGDLQPGQVIAFANYLRRTVMALRLAAMVLVRLSRAGASGARVVEVLDSEPDVQDAPDAPETPSLRGRVVFENVTFRYRGAETPALRDVSFTAEPGQVVAVLGATGSGKSTLVHLILRFYDVESGRITVDGLDVRTLRRQDLRRHVGIALQESVLFSGTIADNIRFSRPAAADEEVVAAARTAQAHEFISALPGGYGTRLGQRGVNLSGGQKQRIAIARALLARPAVLILDDSTSSVDVETEARIEDALREVMAGRTSIVIAQRISTILNADKILVLDSGRLVAEGTHGSLLADSPVYREIYDSQLGGGVGQ
ncbi:MAG: ABC transporter ATP-binding protein [Candidatus Brocadiaceae bacterium]|nr:ABC transporter ATP-binding protein [Candidatus Brocadiaceae bacterium]